MQRLINPRFLLFSAIGLVLGILCGYSLMFGKWLLPLILTCVLAIALTVFLLLKNKLYLVVLFVFIFVILGCGVFQVNIISRQKQEVIARPVVLTGRVTDIGRMGNVSNVIYLDDCTYDNTKIPGRVQVYVFDGTIFQTGDILTIKGTLRSTYPFAENFNTTYLRTQTNYQLTDITIVSRKDGALKLDETIRAYIYQSCTEYMPNHSGLMYALITGDGNALQEDVKHFYQASGMIHLVAVSGMHLVYIITIIGFFIGKLKLKPLAEFAIMIGPLLFFCYVCGWVPSILRALFMTVCAYVVKWLSGRYDMLVSLAFSVVVMLLANPFYLFDIGWQLSVLSVFGMATLHLRIDRFLQSKKLNKFAYGLLSSLSISLSCTVATFATTAHYFDQVPILGIFANLVGVPLMSWAFTLGIVGMLPWIFHYVLHIGDILLGVVTTFAQVVSSLDFAVVSLSAIGIAIAVTVVWLFVLGQYVNIKRRPKVVTNCVLCLLLVLCFVLAGVISPCTDQIYINYNFDGADVVVSNSQGQVVVISNCSNAYSFSAIQKYLSKFSYKSLTWVIADFSQFDAVNVNATDFANVGMDCVFVLTPTLNDNVLKALTEHGIAVMQVESNQTIGESVTVQSVYDGALTGAVVNTGSITFAIVYGGEAQTNHFVDIIPNADFYIVPSPTQRYMQQNLTTFSLYQDYCVTNYGANKYGNFTITQKDGTIIVNF